LTARKAVEAGLAGVIVSNHGARQLDYGPPTISALQEVVKAVAGAAPVLVDGGAPTCSRRWRSAPRQQSWYVYGPGRADRVMYVQGPWKILIGEGIGFALQVGRPGRGMC
jgi:hypothetical protein